jgi:hypothetical protein
MYVYAYIGAYGNAFTVLDVLNKIAIEIKDNFD